MEQATAISRIGFRDRQRAEQNLARIAQRAPAAVIQALASVLAETPDPDAALNLLERLCQSAPADLLRLLGRHPILVHYAAAVFGHSLYLGETLIQNPDLFQAFLREKRLERAHSREEFSETLARFRSRSFETDVALLLARFKKREYIRIMLRDVLRIATLAETTGEISALADVLIEEALREADAALRKRYGAPQHSDEAGRVVDTPFCVLALGKLGGNELNYNSDVDLMFLYGAAGETAGGGLSNREYFIRLAQQVTETLCRPTAEGAVFRIDLRLRPQGREGEPAVALPHALHYYKSVARDWEQQALIKVRRAAGDTALARLFIRSVQPSVYTERLNFAAVETALETRQRISSRRGRGPSGRVNVKLDRGGIRDIQVVTQWLQRVYGGKEAWLRSGGTLFSLQKLSDKGHISGREFHELSAAYEFLRTVEHRLQLRRGQQLHELPQEAAELEIVARAVNPQWAGQAAEFAAEVRQRMAAVAEIYTRIIHQQQEHEADHGVGSEFRLRADTVETRADQPYEQMLRRLAAEMPQAAALGERDLDAVTRRNLTRFLSAAFTSSERYGALTRSPQALEPGLRLLATSNYLTDLLVRHPEEIATLGEIAGAQEARSAELFRAPEPSTAGTDPVFAYVARADIPYGEKMALLRTHYRHRVFAAGARDVLAPRGVYDSIAATTAAADQAITAALAAAGAPAGFAVLALGRLGTREFDLLSDADLLFVREESVSLPQAAQAAQQVMELLSAYTREGTVFAVDPRLRPRGTEGELVSTAEQLRSYFAEEAHPWEALTYSKLRFVAGAEELGEQAAEAVRQSFARFDADPGFAAAVREMRAKLEKSEAEPNFKTAPGGFYDIDFLVSWLLVREGKRGACNIRRRLEMVAHHLAAQDSTALEGAAELLRTVEHVVRLVTGRPRKSLPVTEHALAATERLAAQQLGREFPHGLAGELETAQTKVREVYERVVR